MHHPWNGPFWGISGPFLQQIWLEFVEISYVFHKTKTVSQQSFKIKCLNGNKIYPKLIVLVHFWAQFYPSKPKILPKTKFFFPETASLWLSNNTSSKSQINHRILIKLIKKPHFFAKYGLFKVKNRPVNKDQKVRDQVSTIFTEAPNSGLTLGENVLL